MARMVKSFLQIGSSNENLINPLTLSDEQILEKIYTTHVHSGDTKFDEDSLFTIVESILKSTNHIIFNVVQGIDGSPEQHVEEKLPLTSFSSPLCILRQISSEMTCKEPGEETAHKTTMAILGKLSKYEWDEKAVITLAAFALEYGELWLLSTQQPQQVEPLARSVALLRRVPSLTRPQAVKKHRQALVEINSLVRDTLEVIQLIFALEKLTTYDTKDVPSLVPAMESVPVDVYWAIISVVAVVTQLDCLITDSERRQDLSQFTQKINITLSRLRKQIAQCKIEIEDANYDKKLMKLFQTPTEVMEVFKMLIFGKETPQSPIYDGSTKTLVSIEVLKKKNIYLFISTLDITVEEINILKPVQDTIKRTAEDQYKILWVPIVDQWNDRQKKKFEILKSKMPWLVLNHFQTIKGYKFVKETWGFKKRPMVVVIDPQGKIQHENAFHMIQVWGLTGFPFNQATETKLTEEASWVEPLVVNINPKITAAMKEGKHIFFYGGKDKEWIQQFNKQAGALANDTTLKESKIQIELFCLEFEHPNVVNRFWTGIESLFVTKMNKQTNVVTKEVQKLLSYKTETGWTLITKGSTVVLSGHGNTVLKMVSEFDKWKETVVKSGFDVAVREQHEKVVKTEHRCSHLEIPNVAGKIPETIECPECHRSMEVFISYKCCHKENDSEN